MRPDVEFVGGSLDGNRYPAMAFPEPRREYTVWTKRDGVKFVEVYRWNGDRIVLHIGPQTDGLAGGQ